MIAKWFNPIDDILSVLAIIGISALTIINVFCRFVLNSPISWVEEITLGFFVWLVFIGMSSAMKRGGHIGVDYFIMKLPKVFRNIFNLVGAAAIYFVLIYVFMFLGTELTAQAGMKLTPVLGLSYQYIDFAVPFGGFMTAVHFTVRLIKSFQVESGEKEQA